MRNSTLGNILALALSIAISQLAGLIGTLLSAGNQDWYQEIERPAFSPPGWVFAPVWITLYTMMGTAAYLVWRRLPGDATAQSALALFGGQLVVNSLWTGAFFGLRSPAAGIFVIGTLWVLLVATVIRFWQVRVAAGVLLVPYLLWVSFAAVLNFSIWRLNS